MSLGNFFWIAMLIVLVVGVIAGWPTDKNFKPLGGSLLFFFLLVLLGWGVFGPPIK